MLRHVYFIAKKRCIPTFPNVCVPHTVLQKPPTSTFLPFISSDRSFVKFCLDLFLLVATLVSVFVGNRVVGVFVKRNRTLGISKVDRFWRGIQHASGRRCRRRRRLLKLCHGNGGGQHVLIARRLRSGSLQYLVVRVWCRVGRQ